MTAERDQTATLWLDLGNQCVWRGAVRLDLPPKAFRLLRVLVENQGQLVTKNDLMQAVWPDTFVGDAALTVTIKQIRDLLGDNARKPWLIETAHRRGFRLLAPMTAEKRVPAAASSPPPELSGFVPAGGWSSLVVGRDDALQQLATSWEHANAGRRQIVFVTGEPGIGKTALVDAFVQGLAGASPALVGRGHCVEAYGSTEAYLPILEALEDLLRGGGADAFADHLRRAAPSWLVQLPWLLRDADTPRLQAELQGATRERMLREISTTLEIGSADTPLVLVLEDLHWSDPSTVTLLSFLGQRRLPARLLVIGTYRPVDVIVATHPLREAKQRLQTNGQCVEIPLWFLTAADTRQFLETRLSGMVADSAVDLVHRRSNGNPLFMTSLVEHLRHNGALRERDGRWLAVAEAAPDEAVPAGLRDLIEEGFAHLGSGDLSILEAASVAGCEFATAAVAAGIAPAVAAVDAVCERLARRGDLLRGCGTTVLADGTVSDRYEFVHALVQNVLYQRIAAARRMEMHRRLGLWGESNRAGAGELAHHFALAGSAATASKAIAYAEEAAARSKAVFAYEEAVRHCEGALHVARRQARSDPQQECELLVKLGEAQQRAGHIAPAEETFYQAARQARELADPVLLARAAVGIGHGYQRIGQPIPVLIELLEEALLGLGPQNHPQDHPLRALALAHLDYSLGSVAGALERRAAMAQEALAMARRLDDPETLVWVIQYTRWAFHGPQDSHEWRAGIVEVEALLGRTHDAEQALVLGYVLVTDLLELGEMEAAERALDELAKRAEEAQLPWSLWLVLRLQSTLALLRGEFATAEQLAQQTLESGLRTDHPNVMQLYAGHTTALRIEQGRLEELQPLLQTAVQQNPNVPCWRAVLSYLLCELGELESARAQFELIAQENFADTPRDTAWFVFMGFAAAACNALQDRPRAEALYTILLPFRERSTGLASSLLSLGHMERYLGLLAATAGRRGDAEAHMGQAIRKNEDMGAWPWAVFSRLDYANLLLADGSPSTRRRALALIEPAIDIAERLGMSGWLPRLYAARDAATAKVLAKKSKAKAPRRS